MVKTAEKSLRSLDESRYPQLYEDLLARSISSEHMYYVGVRSTGIACRFDCSARKPEFNQCSFFPDLHSALLEGFRPCLRCKPVDDASFGESLRAIIQRVEAEPQRLWKHSDFVAVSPHVNRDDAQFHRVHGMRILEYARVRRLGQAFRRCRFISEAKNHSTASDCIFSTSMPEQNASPSAVKVSAVFLKTPIGTMFAIASEEHLYLLEFLSRRALESEIRAMKKKYGVYVLAQKNALLEQVDVELAEYFAGTRTDFSIPLKTDGSVFQESVWNALQSIPYGTTCSYAALAQNVENEKAIRAVGRANGANCISILIPCHRVIRSDGTLGGYGGGLDRKAWLLQHEGSQLI